MKFLNKIHYKSLSTLSRPVAANLRSETLDQVISKRVAAFNGLAFRNKGRSLITKLLQVTLAVNSRLTRSRVALVANFSFMVYRLWKHHGFSGTVKYLKTAQVLLMQACGRYVITDVTEVGMRVKRTRGGLPTVIPAVQRDLIRSGDIQVIKFWMTLFGIFRIMPASGKLKLSTIVNPGVEITSQYLSTWVSFIPVFIKGLNETFGPIAKQSLKAEPFLITKSSPGVGTVAKGKTYISTSFFGLWTTAKAWWQFHRDSLAIDFYRFAFLTGNMWIVTGVKAASRQNFPWLPKSVRSLVDLGRLGFKEEPAGKIRVFAMADPWTQWLMKPLHDLIMSVASKIAQDGTFDQLKPVKSLIEKMKSRKRFYSFSLDLSAATDRLPIVLQIPLVSALLENYSLLKLTLEEFAELSRVWSYLLVNRGYRIGTESQYSPSWRKHPSVRSLLASSRDWAKDPVTGVVSIGPKTDGNRTGLLYYAVGQPMGALSSWAMLAMTHHCIVQWAYYRVCMRKGWVYRWFSDYAVLGDDNLIVTPLKAVAHEYLLILREIGVEVGLAKSLIAKNRLVIEFAKKFFVNGQAANMLPIKECIATWTSSALLSEFVRKYELTLTQTLGFLGRGYKSKGWAPQALLWNMPSRLRVSLVWLSAPGMPFAKTQFADWLSMLTWNRSIEVPNTVWDSVARLLKADLHRMELALRLAAYKQLEDQSLVPINTFLKDYSKKVKDLPAGIPKEGEELRNWIFPADEVFDFISPIDTNAYHTPDFVAPKFPSKIVDTTIPLPLGHWNKYSKVTTNKEWVNYLGACLVEQTKALGKVPSSLYSQEKEAERLFSDLSSVYKKWVRWSKPIYKWYQDQRNLKVKTLALVPIGPVIHYDKIDVKPWLEQTNRWYPSSYPLIIYKVRRGQLPLTFHSWVPAIRRSPLLLWCTNVLSSVFAAVAGTAAVTLSGFFLPYPVEQIDRKVVRPYLDCSEITPPGVISEVVPSTDWTTLIGIVILMGLVVTIWWQLDAKAQVQSKLDFVSERSESLISQMSDEVNNLQQSLTMSDQARQVLGDSLSAAQAEVVGLSRQLEQVTASRSVVESALSTAQSKIGSLESLVASLRETISVSDQQALQAAQVLEETGVALRMASSRIDMLEAALAKAGHSLSTVQGYLSDDVIQVLCPYAEKYGQAELALRLFIEKQFVSGGSPNLLIAKEYGHAINKAIRELTGQYYLGMDFPNTDFSPLLG